MKRKKYMLRLFFLSTIFSLALETGSATTIQAAGVQGMDTEPDCRRDGGDFVIKGNTLVKYQGDAAEVVVPDGIAVIGERAFFTNKDIVDVVLPEGLERIEPYAFSSCTFLETVQFPKSLRCIGEGAFQADKNLIHICLPEGLERLEEGVFEFCDFLETVQMPKSLYYIGELAFAYCDRLEEIDLSAVKEIDDYAFYNVGKLIKVDLRSLEKAGNAVFYGTNIDFSNLDHVPEMKGGTFAFSNYWREYGDDGEGNVFWIVDGVLLGGGCSGKVEIPDTVNKIAADAFFGNYDITSVVIPDSVTEILGGAFAYCKNLKTVRMGDSVTKMGGIVFSNCYRLTEVRLSNQLEELPGGTFERCIRLKKLTLPERMKTVGQNAVWTCYPIQVTVPTGLLHFNDTGGLADGAVCYVTDIDRIPERSNLRSLIFGKEIRELALTDTKLTLKVGEKYLLRFNSGAKAAWKSSKKSVATVGQTGNIYAKKPGTTVITATIYGKEYSCTVKVVER